MHQALISGEVMTFTSHFQSGASLRKTAVCGMRRLAIPRTRSTCLGSRLTWPLGLSLWITCRYWAAAAWSSSADETRRSWLRWTPTAPCSVVDEQATSAIANIRTGARPISRLLMGWLLASGSNDRDDRLTRGSRTSTWPAPSALLDRRGIRAGRPLEGGRGRLGALN